MKSMSNLGVQVPSSKTYIKRNLKKVTQEQRERVLKETEYSMFAFPADMLVLDFLSDSGSTSMTDFQWAALLLGDESYGRNIGYYILLDTIRDIFERGDSAQNTIKYIQTGETDVEKLINNLFLSNEEGGFVNGGIHQLTRPNVFITPQGRSAEYLLFSTIAQVIAEKGDHTKQWIPNNGHFDTTGANIANVDIEPVNFFLSTTFDDFPYTEMEYRNPFKGNMDVESLELFIKEKSASSIPMIYLTITNNTICGQPVSMSNIRAVHKIAEKYKIPLFFDACRFAENASFIQHFEDEFSDRTITSIVKEMFTYADGFTISFKKDGLANIGGGLFLRDRGNFINRFSVNKDIGIRLKEKQILTFGNDSYGGLSGRDIMALSAGLHEVVKESYLDERIRQTRYFARNLAINGVPVILPAGGHAVYLDMDRFFKDVDMKTEDYGGLGLCIELVRHYGIRACELGPFAFEWDKKTEEQRKGIINVVRFAIPRNAYGDEHIDYAVAAITELYHNRASIPKVEISRGAELRLRHFQSGLKPIYK